MRTKATTLLLALLAVLLAADLFIHLSRQQQITDMQLWMDSLHNHISLPTYSSNLGKKVMLNYKLYENEKAKDFLAFKNASQSALKSKAQLLISKAQTSYEDEMKRMGNYYQQELKKVVGNSKEDIGSKDEGKNGKAAKRDWDIPKHLWVYIRLQLYQETLLIQKFIDALSRHAKAQDFSFNVVNSNNLQLFLETEVFQEYFMALRQIRSDSSKDESLKEAMCACLTKLYLMVYKGGIYLDKSVVLPSNGFEWIFTAVDEHLSKGEVVDVFMLHQLSSVFDGSKNPLLSEYLIAARADSRFLNEVLKQYEEIVFLPQLLSYREREVEEATKGMSEDDRRGVTRLRLLSLSLFRDFEKKENGTVQKTAKQFYGLATSEEPLLSSTLRSLARDRNRPQELLTAYQQISQAEDYSPDSALNLQAYEDISRLTEEGKVQKEKNIFRGSLLQREIFPGEGFPMVGLRPA